MLQLRLLAFALLTGHAPPTILTSPTGPCTLPEPSQLILVHKTVPRRQQEAGDYRNLAIIQIMVWLALLHGLPTTEVLHRRCFCTEFHCAFCNVESETENHLLHSPERFKHS